MENNGISKTGGKNFLTDLLLIAAAFFALYLGLAFMRPLASPDEGRYSEIPLEMVRNGDYVSPRLNDMVYFYKPPFFYWMQAASIKAFGVNRTSLRFPNAAAAVFGILVTYCAARALYNRRVGIFSAIVAGTSVLYFALGEIITLDMTVAVFISAAMFSFIVALKRSGVWRGVLILSFFAFCALAVMTKGLIGVLIPCATAFLYALALGVFPFFRKLKVSDIWWCVAGAALFTAIAVPWHVLAALANPPYETAEGIFSKNWEGQGFFWYYIVHEHILRYIDPETSMRAAPWWLFLVLAPVGLIPWVVLLPQALRDAFRGGYARLRNEKPEMLFFALWIFFVIAFFSASSSKLPAYIVPIYPAFGVIIGAWMAKVWENPRGFSTKAVKTILVALGYIAAVAPVVVYFVLQHKGKLCELAGGMLALSIAMSATLFVCTTAVLLVYRRGGERAFWVAAILTVFVLLSFFNPLGRYLQRESAQPLVDKISADIKADDTFAIAYNYNELQDFPVWLGRTVYLIGEPPEEQKFGFMRERDKNHPRFITDKAAFDKFLASATGNIYVASDKNGADKFAREMGVPVSEVARSRNLVLLKITRK